MFELGLALVAARKYEDAHAVLETLYRNGTGANTLLSLKTLTYLAKVRNKLGWDDPVIDMSENAARYHSLVPGNQRLSGLTLMRIAYDAACVSLGESDELSHLCALELGVCLLDQNLVDEAVAHLVTSHSAAERALGGSHAVCIEMHWRIAQSIYKQHFFGGNDSRDLLMISISGLVKVFAWATNTLGIEHPTTLDIWASLQLCFEEQLDWTLDDIPRDFVEFFDEIPRPPGHKVFWKYPRGHEASGL